MAQVRGGLIFLLADSLILPLDANQYAASLQKYAQSIAQIAQRHPQEMQLHEVSFSKFSVRLSNKSHMSLSCPLSPCDLYIFLFPDSLFSATDNFTAAAGEFHERVKNLNRAEYECIPHSLHLTRADDGCVSRANSTFHVGLSPLQVRMVNDQLMYLERAFIDPLGLPGRPFYR